MIGPKKRFASGEPLSAIVSSRRKKLRDSRAVWHGAIGVRNDAPQGDRKSCFESLATPDWAPDFAAHVCMGSTAARQTFGRTRLEQENFGEVTSFSSGNCGKQETFALVGTEIACAPSGEGKSLVFRRHGRPSF